MSTAWLQRWETDFRRQRWIERDGYFYPLGTPETQIALETAVRRAQRVTNIRRINARRARGRARDLLAEAPASAPALPRGEAA